jgi:rhodanese-related sulfurtransferase
MKQPTLIDSNQLRAVLAGNSKPLFVDVRPAKEFAAGNIPGAINVPLDDMAQRWSTLPKDRTLIFYEAGTSGDICASARAAARVVLEHGYPFDQVKVYQQGLAGWEKSGLSAAK